MMDRRIAWPYALLPWLAIAPADAGDEVSSSLSLFRELEAAGSYVSVWVGDGGLVQHTEHSGTYIHRIREGRIDPALARTLIHAASAASELNELDYDDTRVHESGVSRLTAVWEGSRADFLFPEPAMSSTQAPRLIERLSGLIAEAQETDVDQNEVRFLAVPVLPPRRNVDPESSWYLRLLQPAGTQQPPIAPLTPALDQPGRFVVVPPGVYDDAASETAYRGVDFVIRRFFPLSIESPDSVDGGPHAAEREDR